MSSDNKFVRSLIENAKQGNNAAIEQLFQMNLGKIYAFALRLTAEKSLAESITKESFIEAWKKINLVRSDSSFLKWLSAITVYKTLDSIRSKKHKHKVDHKELWELESKDELDKYILALPDTERITFVLHRIEGYTIDEISDLMSIKKDQVNTHYKIAVSKLLENDQTLSDDDIFSEKISKVVSEISPSADLRNSIFSYIMDYKIREQREQERIAEELAERDKEIEPVQEEKESVFEEKTEQIKRKISVNLHLLKKIVYVFLAAVVIIGAYIIYTSLGSGWEVYQITGKPMIGNVALNKEDNFHTESTITTDRLSSVTFNIPELGKIFIDTSSIVSRTKKEDELKVEKGKIKKFEGDATEILKVITSLANFTELYKGGAFRLEVQEDGTCMIIVESGWVVISIKGFDSYVPKNFDCLISRGRYAIPYPSDASSQFISLVQNFSGINDPSIGTIISLMTKKEALSMWHIIQLISTENRSIAFDRLNDLIPVPSGVTKAGILALNKTMLLGWRQEIELKME